MKKFTNFVKKFTNFVKKITNYCEKIHKLCEKNHKCLWKNSQTLWKKSQSLQLIMIIIIIWTYAHIYIWRTLTENYYHLNESAYILKNSIKTAHKKLFKISNNFSKIKMSFNDIGCVPSPFWAKKFFQKNFN